jgi:hypothetical protein
MEHFPNTNQATTPSNNAMTVVTVAAAAEVVMVAVHIITQK